MDLPVERAARFELTVNLITAKALGLELSARFLSQATAVIR
jgi:hypothetical protein